MHEAEKRYDDLLEQVSQALAKLSIEEKQTQLKDLQAQTLEPDFWNDNQAAQTVSKKVSALEKQITPWLKLSASLAEVGEFIQLQDDSLGHEIDHKLAELEKTYQQLKGDVRFSGEYDDYDVIMNIQSGAGGTDAQDWAEMLRRMYLRWAEQHSVTTDILDESAGDEAGIKSSSLRFSGGSFLYGKLKGEHGVHRLVRMSPFNSAGSRETSFAMVEVIPEIDEPGDIVIDEKDLKVDVFRAGGHGGQSVNTTDSAVRITHQPTGIVVSIQNERSQIQNKETAMKILLSKLIQLKQQQHLDTIDDLKGENQEAAWGNQIRNYVLHPYTLVKDSRSNYETSDAQAVLDGKIDELIEAYLDATLGD